MQNQVLSGCRAVWDRRRGVFRVVDGRGEKIFQICGLPIPRERDYVGRGRMLDILLREEDHASLTGAPEGEVKDDRVGR